MATYTTITEEEQKKQETEQQTTAAPELNTATTQQTTVETPEAQSTATKTVSTRYDPTTDASYQQAMSALEAAKQQMPSYQNSYEAKLQELYEQITGRGNFTYNVNEDALYQQYKDRYVNQGQMAMKDTMGQAAALTGGYGSSYGQSVGQQQYNAYLQNLNDVVPELYGMAYQQYQDQGDALKDQYSMMGQLADDEYSKYQDALTQYYQQLNYLQGQADDIYNRGMEQAELAYSRQQDAYSNLVNMITTLGYKPTSDELEEAGMTTAQYKAYKKYYNNLNSSSSYSSSGGGGTIIRTDDNTNPLTEYDKLNNMLENMRAGGATSGEMATLIQSAAREESITPEQRETLIKKYPQNAVD